MEYKNDKGEFISFINAGLDDKENNHIAVSYTHLEEIDEFIREALALRYLTSYEVNTVSPKVQYDRKELIRVFDEANNMLRGEGLRAGIERFGEFANILFLKLISESEQIKKESGIQTKFDISCSWDSIKKIPSSARIEYINNTVYDLSLIHI